jgi:4-hydroxy-tetrahydrodipicolinate synthase
MFRGAYTALITPFRNGKVDYAALEALIEYQIAGGIDGLVPCGTTGESPTLTDKEHDEVIAFAVKIVRKRVTVIAGTGSNSTAEAIERTRHAKEAGADAALLVTPYYNKPNQRGLIAHFTAIADAVDIPQILYNIPGRSVININPETLAELSRHRNIVAVKESTGNLEQMTRIKALCGPDFDLISGDDPIVLPVLSIGGVGVVSVTSNLIPGETSRMVHSYLEGKVGESRELFYKYYDLIKTILSVDVNPVGIKTVMALRGQVSEEFRLPLVPLTAESKEVLRKELEKYNLLSVKAAAGSSR